MSRARGSREGERSEGDQPMQHGEPSVWEWVAAALGGALVVGALGFMTYEAATRSPHPTPKLAIRIDTVVAYPGGYIVEFRATNAGDATAADVLVQGELRSDTSVVERSESTVDFVPARSWRTGALVFAKDPRAYRMEVRPVGFGFP